MKYLVEDASQEVRAGFQTPFESSIAGHFVMDVPDELGVVPTSSFLPDLIAAKEAAYQAAHMNLTNGILSSEFLVTSNIYLPQSDGFIMGAHKRVGILPGGHVQTTAQTLSGSFTKIFFHFGLFTFFQFTAGISDSYSAPLIQQYNWDVDLNDLADQDPNQVQVSLKQASNNDTLANLFSDSVISYAGTGLSFRLEFANPSTTKTLYLSDYYMLWG